MSLHHDEPDDLPGAPDEPASPGEEARARAFAALVDDLVAGDTLPPGSDAGAADDDTRSLLDTAAILRVNLRPPAADTGMSALIGDVLARARTAHESGESGESAPTAAPPAPDPTPDPAPDSRPGGDVIDLGARRAGRRGRLLHYAPVTLAAMAAAAALVLALRTPAPEQRGRPDDTAPQYSMMHRSRPADPLIGEIPRTRADRAGDRLDIIYADRMAGYRDLTLRGGRR